MSTKENIESLKKAATEYSNAVLKLYNELQLSDTPADYGTWKNLSDDIEKIRISVQSIQVFLEETQIRVRLQSHINYHFRKRYYVLRRKTERVGTEVTWSELQDLSTEGPWQAEHMTILDICQRRRDDLNKIENSDRPNIRGWRKGAYTWEIWGYDPTSDSWTLIP